MRSTLPCLGVLLLASCGPAPGRSATTPAVANEPTAAPVLTDPRMTAILEAHTRARAEHCAPPLRWSEELAARAQSWADHLAASGCGLVHSQSGLGENLAAGSSGAFSPERIVGLWYEEAALYDFARGGFSMETGHFTQLVWLSSTQLGCGIATCGGLDVWVCNYDPPGNYEGQYRQNVRPTSCR